MSGDSGKNSSRRGVLAAQDGWRSWYSHEVLPSYMCDKGAQSLLSQDEEAFWAKRYQESREAIRNLIQSHPQVILSKLRELNESLDRTALSNFIVLSRSDEEEFNDDDDMEIDDRLSNVESDLLNKIFDNSSEVIHKCIRGLAKDGKETDEGIRAVAEIIGPYLRSGGKVHFQQRFYKDCVELFISGKWHEEGLSESEKKLLCDEMRKSNEQERQAMTALVEGNLRLVISVARRFSSGYMSLPDLVQEGNIGLMRAIENFDWSRGHKLSTYACYCIRQSISRALSSNGRAIRIPSNILRQLAKIHRCEQTFIQENFAEPTDEQLAELVEISPARVRALKRMEFQPISLQSMATEDRDWNDLLADKSTLPVAGDAPSKEVLCESLRMALDTLQENEKDILVRRFGLYGEPVQSLKVLADRYNLTCERIRQIEAGALLKLRRTHGSKFRDDE